MNETLHHLLMADHLLFQKELLSSMKNTTLTPGQPKILEYLLSHDGAVQKEIAEACHIEPATITSVLLGMENKGLVIRKNRNRNRRNLYVYLTEDGKALAKQVCENFQKIEKNALAGFDDSEKSILVKLLSKVSNNMKGTQNNEQD